MYMVNKLWIKVVRPRIFLGHGRKISLRLARTFE